MRKIIILIGVFLVLGIGAYSYMSGSETQIEEQPPIAQAASSDTGVTVGKIAPSMTLKDLNGNNVEINAAQDKKIYVINFWATWCGYCVDEMPELEDFYHNYGDKVQFFALNLQESKAEVNEFLQDEGYTFPVLLDEKGKTGNLFKIKGIPTTIVIDSTGTIIYRWEGQIDLPDLEKTVETAINKQ